MQIKERIIKAIQTTTGIKEIHLETPAVEIHGDYSTNIAMVLAKKEKKNPQELAEDIAKKLS